MNLKAPKYSGQGSRDEPPQDDNLPRDEAEWIKRYQKRPDMSWRDHLVMLLTFGAAAEHCLMVQYLYAAYSLHTDKMDVERSAMIERWRSDILAVCKEEMGHLLTVQNILLLLGAPATLARDNSIWAEKYYPYPFSLDPLDLDTLRCFVYAEMPDPDSRKFKDLKPDEREILNEIIKKVEERFRDSKIKADVHRVGALYSELIELISSEERIPDSEFDDSSYEFQASWDAWGRGYHPAPYELDAEGNRKEAKERKSDAPPSKDPPPPAEAYVRVDRVATRADAIKALVAIATQGEAPELHVMAAHESFDEPSHFERFFSIYRQMQGQENHDWARDVCSNPTTQQPPLDPKDPPLPPGSSPITAIVGKRLAQVFNQRYRLLLSYLAHSFRIAGDERVGRPNRRAMLMHRVFGEMYNLKTLAGLLVRTPRMDATEKDDGKPKNAGPPFEMPYSLSLPDADVDIWRAHLDLIETSRQTCERLLDDAAKSGSVRREVERINAEPYVRTLMALDDEARKWIRVIVAGDRSKGAMWG